MAERSLDDFSSDAFITANSNSNANLSVNPYPRNIKPSLALPGYEQKLTRIRNCYRIAACPGSRDPGEASAEVSHKYLTLCLVGRDGKTEQRC